MPINIFAEEIEKAEVTEEVEGNNETEETAKIEEENNLSKDADQNAENEVKDDQTEDNKGANAKLAKAPLLTATPNGGNGSEGDFKVALRWGGTSDTTYNWDATQSEYYVIRAIVDGTKKQNYILGSRLTGDDFTYTVYYSGGQQVRVESSFFDSITFNGKSTYTQNEIGNYMANVELTYKGKTYENEVTTKWILPEDYFNYRVLSNMDKTIVITGVSSNYISPEVLYIPSEYKGYKVIGIRSPTNVGITNIANVKIIELEDGIEEIGNYALRENKNLIGISLPDTLTSIGEMAFYNCSGLTGNLVIPEGVTSIGNSAFNGCSGLTGELVIPKGVTSISDGTFWGCKFTSVKIPEGVTSIESSAFNRCSLLKSIDLPDTVTSIGMSAFYGCNILKTINYHGTPEQFAAISVESSNEYFTRATVNYITD